MSYYKAKSRPTWTVGYTDSAGKRQYIYGIASRELAKQKDAQLKFHRQAVRLKLVDAKADRYAIAADQPLSKHLDDFQKALAARGNTDKHVRESRQLAEAVFAAASIDRIDQIDRAAVLRACDAVLATRSRRTRNKRLGAAKTFVAWLFDQSRIATNALARMAKLDEEQDRRRIRRMLSDEEINRLMVATKAGPMRGGMTGEDRYMRYLLAFQTGFRQATLWSLRPADFHLDDERPYIHVTATNIKSRKTIDHPIPVALAAALAPWLKGKPRNKPVFTKSSGGSPIISYRADLRAAGIDYHEAETNLFADQHAMRNAFITAVLRSTGNLKVAQDLAHHSTPLLTGRYARLGMDDYTKAMDGLPGLPAAPQAATAKRKEGAA